MTKLRWLVAAFWAHDAAAGGDEHARRASSSPFRHCVWAHFDKHARHSLVLKEWTKTSVWSYN